MKTATATQHYKPLLNKKCEGMENTIEGKRETKSTFFAKIVRQERDKIDILRKDSEVHF